MGWTIFDPSLLATSSMDGGVTMKDSDVVVEVRNSALVRLGQILPEELRLSIMHTTNGVGEWTLTLPYEHRLRAELQKPGAGIVVLRGDGREIFSGPMTNPTLTATRDDPLGTVVIKGISDDVILQDALAFPVPGEPDVRKQKQAYDTRSGAIESLMHAFVKANIGPGAHPSRRKANLAFGTDGGRGEVIKKSARFETLGALLTELADISDINFRVIQRGSSIVFETYEVVDRSSTIRLDVMNGTLASQEVGFTAPTATRAVVAGAGDLTKRQFLEVTSKDTADMEFLWGRRIERMLDERTTDDPRDLKVKGDELLAKEGVTNVSIRVVPMDEETMVFGTEWDLGDRVAVTASETEFSSTVVGMVMRVDTEGIRYGAMIGDPALVDSKLRGLLSDLKKRVAGLEIGIGKRPREVGGPLTGSLTEALKQFDDILTYGSANVIVMGGSAAEGVGAPSIRGTWIEAARRRLRTWNFLNNGVVPTPLDTCFVRPGYSAGAPAPYTSGVSVSQNTAAGFGGLSVNIGPGGSLVIPGLTFDYVKLHFMGASGASLKLSTPNGTLSVSGSTGTTITPETANKPQVSTLGVWNASSLAWSRQGNVSLKVENIGSAPCMVACLIPRFLEADLRLYNYARSGATLEDYISSPWAASHWEWARTLEHEHAIWLAGRAEMASLSPDQWGDLLVRLLDRQEGEIGKVPTTIYHWVERADAASPFMFRLFEDAAYAALKDRTDVSLVFLSDSLPGEADARQTWLNKTTYAPTPGGHVLLGQRVASFFMQ